MSEERSLQSQASQRRCGPRHLPLRPRRATNRPHLSHLPNANTFSRPRLQGLRRWWGRPRRRRPGTGGTLKHPSPLQESGRVLLCPGVWGGAPSYSPWASQALQGPFRTHILSGRTAAFLPNNASPVCCTWQNLAA